MINLTNDSSSLKVSVNHLFELVKCKPEQTISNNLKKCFECLLQYNKEKRDCVWEHSHCLSSSGCKAMCIIDRDKKNNGVVLCNASLVHVGKHSFLLKELRIMKTAEVHWSHATDNCSK